MGSCLSCLGRRDSDDFDAGEDSRLLYEDANGLPYGSFNDPAMGGDETLEGQREHEALQRVIAKTSDNMVDVFEIGPHESLRRRGPTAPFAYAGQGARLARYQHLVSKLSTEDMDASQGIRVDWLTDDDDDDDDEAQTNGEHSANVKNLRDGNGSPLVGTFADAAAAMN